MSFSRFGCYGGLGFRGSGVKAFGVLGFNGKTQTACYFQSARFWNPEHSIQQLRQDCSAMMYCRQAKHIQKASIAYPLTLPLCFLSFYASQLALYRWKMQDRHTLQTTNILNANAPNHLAWFASKGGCFRCFQVGKKGLNRGSTHQAVAPKPRTETWAEGSGLSDLALGVSASKPESERGSCTRACSSPLS